MVLFNFWKKSEPQPQTAEFDQAKFIQKRRHQRYDINEPSLCTLELPDTPIRLIPVTNVSHFGCFVAAADGDILAKMTLPLKVKFNIAGRSQPVEITKADKRGGGYGLSFSYDSIENLQIMGELLAPLRNGSSAVHLGDETLSGGPSRQRSRFRGEGSFDLTIELSSGEALTFLMGTFLLPNGEYVSVIWNGNDLITKKSLAAGDPSARMAQSDKPEKRLVAMLATACLALKYPVGARCARLLCQLSQGLI